MLLIKYGIIFIMEFDRNKDEIRLSDEERRVLRTPKETEWSVTGAWKLLELAEFELTLINDMDPSVTPFVAERQQMLARKQHDGALLRRMLDELSPYAAEGIGDEAARFLEGQDS